MAEPWGPEEGSESCAIREHPSEELPNGQLQCEMVPVCLLNTPQTWVSYRVEQKEPGALLHGPCIALFCGR